MSIALVIIGLIVGGILVGQDLVRAAGERAQITQIEKFQSAVATFYGKYGGLPGDITAAAASQFGFSPRGQYAGEGDGNGIIQGVYYNGSGPGVNDGKVEWGGETTLFWMDLSQAGLIEGSFTAGTIANCCQTISVSQMGSYFPPAKIGNGNYIYVWSGHSNTPTNINYFGLSVPSSPITGGDLNSTTGLTVKQAYDIDTKIDDGLPQAGNVKAYLGTEPAWPATAIDYVGDSFTSPTVGLPASCFDNSNNPSGTPGVSGAVQHYSIEISNGTGVNCALAFRLQTGD